MYCHKGFYVPCYLVLPEEIRFYMVHYKTFFTKCNKNVKSVIMQLSRYLKISLLWLCKMSHCCTLEGAQLNFALFKISFWPIILFPSPTLRYIPRHFVQISKHFLLFFNTNEVGIEFNAMKLFTMATNMSILYDTWIV